MLPDQDILNFLYGEDILEIPKRSGTMIRVNLRRTMHGV